MEHSVHSLGTSYNMRMTFIVYKVVLQKCFYGVNFGEYFGLLRWCFYNQIPWSSSSSQNLQFPAIWIRKRSPSINTSQFLNANIRKKKHRNAHQNTRYDLPMYGAHQKTQMNSQIQCQWHQHNLQNDRCLNSPIILTITFSFLTQPFCPQGGKVTWRLAHINQLAQE